MIPRYGAWRSTRMATAWYPAVTTAPCGFGAATQTEAMKLHSAQAQGMVQGAGLLQGSQVPPGLAARPGGIAQQSVATIHALCTLWTGRRL
jgi:hypothetical protein